MQDTDKIVRRCCAETEEGLKRPKRVNPWQRGLRKRTQCSSSTESWTYRWTKSQVMLETPDHVAQSATVMGKRSLIFLLMMLQGLLFKHRQLKTLRKVMTQKVKASVADIPRVLGRCVPHAKPVVQTEEKIVEVQQVQTMERIVEVLQIQCQEVIRHVTAPQIQEAIRQVTVFPRWCLRLMSGPTECVFVDSDTRYGWNPSTTLQGTAFHGPISQTHASRSTTKDC